MKPSLRLLSVLVLLPFAAAIAQDKPDLHVGAKKGDKQIFRQKSVQTQSIDMGGQQMESGGETTQVFEIEITGVGADGSLDGAMKILRTSGKLTMPMATEEMTFDSAAGEAEGDDMGISSAMTAFAGKSFPIKISRTGEVTDIKGANEALAEARKKATGMAGQMLGGQLNESTLRRLAQAGFGRMPEKPIAVGESFDKTTTNKSRNRDMVATAHYTLAKVDAQQVEMTVTGTVAMPEAKADGKAAAKADGEDPDNSAAHAMMKEMKIEKSKLTGKDVFARDTGMVISSQQKMELSMTLPSPMGEGEIAIDSVSDTTTERGTEADAKPAKKAAAKDDKKDEPKKEATKGH